MLQIYLFGHLRVLVNGAPWTFTARPKVIPLWAYLLLHRASPVPRETLAYTLWPDDAEADARANLRRHLHHLQRALPSAPPDRPWLLTNAETIQWNPAAECGLDVAEFERLSASEDRLADAVALYTGELLAEVYDDWLFYERERLAALYVANLSRLTHQRRAARDYPQAIALVRQLLARDPLHEEALRQLLTLRYEAGDRAGALQDYEGFVHQLREELAVEPMPETVALYEAMVRQARLPGAPPLSEEVAPTGVEAARLVLPLVGREAELAQLSTYWSRATRGRGGVVLIGGEAGIGKTRLAAELALIAEAQGARVLRGGTTFGHLEASSALLRQVNQPAHLGTALGELTLASLRAGDLAAAQRAADELLALYASAAEHMTHPQYLLWAAARAYWAAGKSQRAQELLTQAHAALQQQAEAIPDPESRTAFLHQYFNYDLLAASERGVWPQDAPT